jgi:L-alanine-DL-glutamate epimerase-like enolase superfamily enzyme
MEDGYMDRNPFGTPQPQSGTLALPEEPGLGTHLDFDLRSGSSVA